MRPLVVVLVAASFLGCAHIPGIRESWPAETKATLVAKCTLFNVISKGNPIRESRFYCSCMADELEAQRPASWLEVEDVPEDEIMEMEASAKCTGKTNATFPGPETGTQGDRT